MKPFLACFSLLCLLAGCSSERNTWTSKTYHNLTAHYNGYFYALEEINKIEGTIRQSHIDDYNRVLWIFPSFDSTLANGYEKEIEEAIKMASISIQRHPNSKWVDDAYLLIGKARLYSLDWGNAIQTFKFVNTKSKDRNARHRAIIHLIRTFNEHGEFNNAQAAIDYLSKEKLNRENLKALYLEKAYYYQVLDDYDNMVRSLIQADPLLTKRDRRGRIYFIIGQVYQELGFDAQAFNYYKKCLSTNPEYEVDFYARLYMAQVAEISRNKDIAAARKSFRRLLKDNKNRDFRDKIYYEMGVFELKQKNLDQAIDDFNLALRRGTNRRVDGEAYLRLGEIYYDTLKKYELSQAYYDSAINALPTDYENYESIKARQEILNEFVKNLKTIEWQDSLLQMVSLDSITLRNRIDSVITAQKKLEELAAGKKKKKRLNRIEIESNDVNIFNTGEITTESGTWYFGNPSARAMGETEFVRTWGDVPLEDNWRRSLKGSSGGPTVPIADNNNPIDSPDGITTEQVPIDPVAIEFERINREIPRTEEQKAEALKKIDDAYFRVGDIYYFDLKEMNNAVMMYEKLLKRFPTSEHEPEVLYKLYLILKDKNDVKAEKYASLLKQKYPNSSFAKILINPNFLKESGEAAEKQKVLYKTAYSHFTDGNYHQARKTLEEAKQLGETTFTPHLDLLNILIIGKTDDVSKYQYSLQQFTYTYPDHELVEYAQKLLEASRELATSLEKRNVQFIHSPEGPHYFVIVYKNTTKIADAATTTLEGFNKTYFESLKLNTSNLTLNEEYSLTLVSDLSNGIAARKYFKAFNDKVSTFSGLRNYKFDNFVITKTNFDIFYRTKGLDEYIRFFEKKYQAENP